ncbi:proline racemase [Natronospirillum operosum]|uniref:Proline racemase n=1 Tax=Natronospirillum operosum TaxID=2759953 RepID=A0A4Z0W851_9GAMM|nr:proline racemase family protein [Natronospirillum operosum]TGG91123.1 proline racemase [Natronospirillum operosum]
MPERTGRMRSLELIDTQSGGDVSRIVVDGIGLIPGTTVLDKMRYLQDHGDGLRRLLLSEPYGDPAMSVDLIVEPSHPEAQAGYIIMEAMGYPLYSGSNTICTATAVLESGIVPIQDGEQDLVLESPAGLARIKAFNHNGRVESITTQGEPAYVAARDLSITVPNYGVVRYDLVWSGAFFALVDATALGFEIVADEQIALAAFGDAFVRAVRPEFRQIHPDLGDVGPLPFAHFTSPWREIEPGGYESRSATYVHPGVICRSPTGTGTSARLALMYEKGEIRDGEYLETISPRNSRFRGTVIGEASVGEHRALDSHITGRAWTLAHSTISVDLDDPLVDISDLEHLLPSDAPHFKRNGG